MAASVSVAGARGPPSQPTASEQLALLLARLQNQAKQPPALDASTRSEPEWQPPAQVTAPSPPPLLALAPPAQFAAPDPVADAAERRRAIRELATGQRSTAPAPAPAPTHTDGRVTSAPSRGPTLPPQLPATTEAATRHQAELQELSRELEEIARIAQATLASTRGDSAVASPSASAPQSPRGAADEGAKPERAHSRPLAAAAAAALVASHSGGLGRQSSAEEAGGGGCGGGGADAQSARGRSRERPSSAAAKPLPRAQSVPRSASQGSLRGGRGGSGGGSDRASSRLASSASSASLRAGSERGAQPTLARRASVAEQTLAAERANCTFKPQILPLPAMYARQGSGRGAGASFYERAMSWFERRRQLANLLERQREEDAAAECTFRPQTNAESARLLEGIRRGERDLSRRIATRTQLEALEAAQRREQEQLRECTFRPAINPNSVRLVSHRAPHGAVSGSRSADDLRADEHPTPFGAFPLAAPDAHRARARRAVQLLDAEMRECTFHPRTNPVAPEASHLQHYLEQSPFERLSRARALTRPRTASAARDDLALVDRTWTRAAAANTASERESAQVQARGDTQQLLFRSQPPSPSFAMQARAVAAAAAGDGGRRAGGAGNGEDEERQRALDEFLQRQETHERRRREHLERRLADEEGTLGRPRICKRSVELVEQRSDASFLERLRESTERRRRRQAEVTTSDAAECTFHPRISPLAQRLRARTPSELCDGEMLKKETRLNQMRLALTREELREATFRPQLSAHAVAASGTLRLNEDPAGYVERLRARVEKEQALRRELLEAKEAEDGKECTFRPQIRQAPDFVKRIAASTRQLKAQISAAAAEAAPAPRPAWR
jgi:hypothetical protein